MKKNGETQLPPRPPSGMFYAHNYYMTREANGIYRVIISILFLFFFFDANINANAAEPEHNAALIIGTTKYADSVERIDVMFALMKAITSLEASGYEINFVFNSDTTDIMTAAESLAEKSQSEPYDQVVVYVAGAAWAEYEWVKDATDIYFAAEGTVLPWRKHFRDIPELDLRIRDLHKILTAIRTNNLVVILDSDIFAKRDLIEDAIIETLSTYGSSIKNITMIQPGRAICPECSGKPDLYKYLMDDYFGKHADLNNDGKVFGNEFLASSANFSKREPIFIHSGLNIYAKELLFQVHQSPSPLIQDWNLIRKNTDASQLLDSILARMPSEIRNPGLESVFNELFLQVITPEMWRRMQNDKSDFYYDLRSLLETHLQLVITHDDAEHLNQIFHLFPDLKNSRTLYFALKQSATRISHMLLQEHILPYPSASLEDFPAESRDVILYFSPEPVRTACRWSKLWEAIYLDDLDRVKKLLPKFDKHQHDVWMRTPLHVAAAHGHNDIFRYLLSLGYSIDDQDNYKETPIDTAFKLGYTDIISSRNFEYYNLNALGTAVQLDRFNSIELMLAQLSNKSQENIPYETASSENLDPIISIFQYAIIYSRTDIVKLMLPKIDELGYSWYLLQYSGYAAINGPAASLELIHNYADPEHLFHQSSLVFQSHSKILAIGAVRQNYLPLLQIANELIHRQDLTNSIDTTLLHAAAESNQAQMVEYLLNQEFDLCQKDARGRLPLMLALKDGHRMLTRTLMRGSLSACGIKSVATPVFLQCAVEGGHEEMVQWVLLQGVSPDSRSPIGWSPLHWAALHGNTAIARILLEHGANPNSRDFRGRTPLLIAAMYAHPDIVDLLLSHGANTGIADYDGRTFLHTIAMGGGDLTAALRSGLAPGDDAPAKRRGLTPIVNALTLRKETPLHYAATFGSYDIVKLLIDAGASINAVNVDGETPLQRAIEEGHIEIVQYLLQHGADTRSKDTYGWDAMKMAQSTERYAIEAVISKSNHSISNEFGYHLLTGKIKILVGFLLIPCIFSLFILMFRLVNKSSAALNIINSICRDRRYALLFILIIFATIFLYTNLYSYCSRNRDSLVQSATYYSSIDTKNDAIRESYFNADSLGGQRWINEQSKSAESIFDHNISFILHNYNFHKINSLRLNVKIFSEIYHPDGWAQSWDFLIEMHIKDKMFDYTTLMHEMGHWYDQHSLSDWESKGAYAKISANVLDGTWLQQYRQMDKFTRFHSTWRDLLLWRGRHGTYVWQIYANTFESERQEDSGMEDSYPARQADIFRPVFYDRGNKSISQEYETNTHLLY